MNDRDRDCQRQFHRHKTRATRCRGGRIPKPGAVSPTAGERPTGVALCAECAGRAGRATRLPAMRRRGVGRPPGGGASDRDSAVIRLARSRRPAGCRTTGHPGSRPRRPNRDRPSSRPFARVHSRPFVPRPMERVIAALLARTLSDAQPVEGAVVLPAAAICSRRCRATRPSRPRTSA